MLNAGDSGCTTGLSKRIYDYWLADSRSGFASPMTPTQEDMLKSLCWAIARGVVGEIQANASVSVTISTTTGRLQREVNDLGATVDTLPPSATRTLPGTVS